MGQEVVKSGVEMRKSGKNGREWRARTAGGNKEGGERKEKTEIKRQEGMYKINLSGN